MDGQLSIFEIKGEKVNSPKVVNVSSVPQRSPFRYPGGKTWLIPVVRKWLKQSDEYKTLIEPFVGGGIVSLTAAFENLAHNVEMIELDEEIAAVWEVIINGDHEWLANKIYSFDLTPRNANNILQKEKKTIIFVTHDLGSVERFCNRTIFLEKGKIKFIGNSSEAVKIYQSSF